MKIIKIVVIPAILAVIAYGVFVFLKESNKAISPLPEDGIKVIQVTPDKM